MRIRMLPTFAVVALSLGLAAPTASAQDEDAFCKAIVDTSLVFNQVEDEPTPKQEKQITKLTKRVEQNAPAELADTVTTVLDAVRTGNFEDPAAGAAITAIDEYVASNCGYPVSDVIGRDYSFEGIPSSVDSGINVFSFTNEGAELHEMVVARIKGDETVEEILDLPEQQVNKKVQFLGGTFAEQGGTSYLYADLKKPGRYVAVCFLPVGSTDSQAIETAEGPPHAAEGMVAEFEVQ